MNIKTKLKIAFLIICAACISLGSVIYILFRDHGLALEKMKVAQDIAFDVFERRYLADEYVSNQSDRAKIQWISSQRNIEAKFYVNQSLFNEEEEKRLMMRISEGIAASGKIFIQMAEIYEKDSGKIDPEIIREKEERLSSQMSTWTQESMSAAAKLADANSRKILDNFQEIITIFSYGVAFLLAILVWSLASIWRNGKELYDQKEKNELILQGIGDGIVVISRDWKITLFNKAAGSLSGWLPQEAVGKPFREVIKFIREKDREENFEFIERAMVLGKIQSMENHTVLATKDGREIPIGDSVAPLFTESGEIVGAIIIFRDVSKEREANMLKSDFAYASHQFRTPISKALWGLEAALEEAKIGSVRENIRNSLLALKSINKLSQALLEISEIDQGQIIPAMQKIKADDLILEAIDLVRESAIANNITIDFQAIPEQAPLKSDPKLLKRCLYEILCNAVLYSPRNSRIKVGMEVREGDLIIEIRDSGIGITEKEQPLIFGKFFRGSNFNVTDIAGAGLGLYIAKNYISLLKGKIWFKSKDGSGTEVFIALPLPD